jgi:alkanesulfonate monooxygenase
MNSNYAVDTVASGLQPKHAPWLQVFSTCPSSATTPEHYAERVAQVARWSERAGCTGILIYTDNSIIDPWMVSQIILQNTAALSPLVAIQPIYMHPYSVAKMVSTAGFLYGRRMFLNMVAGGFKNDLLALGDSTPHDSRYQRLTEYTTIIQELLEARGPFSFEGQFYKINGLILKPPLAPELRPGILVSGSSDAGLAAARAIGAMPVKYPEPINSSGEPKPRETEPCGVRIGIITRLHDNDAWAVAHDRFPADRRGQLTRQLASKISDSAWHKQLADAGARAETSMAAYWLHPFENYQTNCPYLVGSYDTVAGALTQYIEHGYQTFILDIPPTEEELNHIGRVFQAASKKARV